MNGNLDKKTTDPTGYHFWR